MIWLRMVRSQVKKRRPERMCIGCGKKRLKNELLRFVCDSEGCVRPDIQRRRGRRGAYMCFNNKCLEAAVRDNRFNRAFRRKVDASDVARTIGI